MPTEHYLRVRSESADCRHDRYTDEIDDLRRQLREQRAAKYLNRMLAKILPLALGQRGRGKVQEQAWVTYRYVVSQGQEPGVVLSVRDLDRLIERLDGCRPSDWADLWLALAGAGAALAAGALVGALTLPAALAGARDVLWALFSAGVVIFALCLFGHLTQRHDHGKEISELEKDLKLRKGARG